MSKPRRARHHLRNLLPYLRPHRKTFLIGLGWLALTNILALAIPWMLKLGVDAVSAGRMDKLVKVSILLALAAGVRCGCRIVSRLRYLHTARLVEVDLRRDLFSRLLDQPATFFDRHRTGDLLSRFTNDLSNVRMMSGFGVMTILNTVMVYLFNLVVLLTLSPGLTLIALIPYPLMLIVVKRLSRQLLQHSSRVQEAVGRVSEAVEEGVSGQTVIRACGQYRARSAAFAELNSEYLERNLVLVRLRALVMPVMTLVGPTSTLLVLYFGGQRVIGKSLSLGDLVAFNAYLMQLAWPTLLLGWVLTLWQRAAASMERLNLLLNLPAPTVRLTAPQPAETAPQVEVRDLDFSYGEQAVLRRLNFDIPAGRITGLIGPTASGKSTLVKLLTRLYLPPAGTVRIDGVDLTKLDRDAYRRQMSVVLQESRLFSGSVEENLLFPQPTADSKERDIIATRVQLRDEIASFPADFATRVGEGGLAVSGGQRQRIALGRALAQDGRLWLLDEPFSHLDAATSRRLWQELRPLLADRTVLLVSSRTTLLSDVDHILVLDKGQISEQGKHDDLLSQGGIYARMAERERLRDELEAWS